MKLSFSEREEKTFRTKGNFSEIQNTSTNWEPSQVSQYLAGGWFLLQLQADFPNLQWFRQADLGGPSACLSTVVV